ncbi:hypothetical protein FDECE_3456 [Neofusicoccum parvum]|uniref:Uncharacterized protein n=1 Tax=Neofusicoccum parvum TaxID=310453 RepID=A0ACB5SB61_9PEZI|nr:hypothetical protein FDECE_3456 [Neofusicoccum parvum]GME37600.1 hypothetical protein FDECE_3456 [Neofusicoccum parvum]
MASPNLNINHVAISVPDAAKAVEWYTTVLGLRVISPLTVVSSADDLRLTQKIYGPELREMKIAILAGGNGVGFEIFEFRDPRYSGPERRPAYGPETYSGGGFFHVCFTSAEPEKVLAKALAAGARQVGETIAPGEGETCFYMQDPWGNIVEILSCSFEQLFLKNALSRL